MASVETVRINNMENKSNKVKFEIGGMWEEQEWEIFVNHECQSMGGGEPCKHCSSPKRRKWGENAWDKSPLYDTFWICPRVVVGINEGGYSSTGICLDCIIEAATTLQG